VWQGAVLADSADLVARDGVVYFPPDAVDWRYLQRSAKRTWCPWKGRARYYTVAVGEAVGRDAAWTYPRPWPWSGGLRGRVAFGPPIMIDTPPAGTRPRPA
jgi:uncharacterized protein (DUF427 family)